MFNRKVCFLRDIFTHNCITYVAPAMEATALRIAVKDNIAVKDQPLTCASSFLQGFISTYDSDVVRILKERGASFPYRTNMDEFGMGSTTSNSFYGPTQNAINPDFSPGGSSGGSAVAVALGYCEAALGSDTGGSIRLPAACNQIIGFKSSNGRISRHGLVSYAPSLDTIGFFAKTVDLVERLFEWTKDQGSLIERVENRQSLRNVAISQELNTSDSAEKMVFLFPEAVHHSYDLLEEALEHYYVIACCEAMSTMSRYNANAPFHKSDSTLSDLVKARVERGRQIMLKERERYYKAQEYRQRLSAVFEHFDLLIMPTIMCEPTHENVSNESIDRNLVIVNLLRAPAITIPHPLFPWGLQLVSRPGSDEELLRKAKDALGR